METKQLLLELSKKPAAEIEFVLTELLADGTFDYVTLSQCYVRSLEYKEFDSFGLLFEANSCILDSLSYAKPPKRDYQARHIQRCLYHLNTYANKNFNLQHVNEKFSYRPDVGKSESVYEKMRINGCLRIK